MSHCWQKWQTRQRCRRAPAPLEHACAAGRGDWLSLSGGGREGFLFAFTDPTRPGTSRRFGPQGIKNNTSKDSEDKEGAPGGMTRRGKPADSERWAAVAAPPTRNRNWLRALPGPRHNRSRGDPARAAARISLESGCKPPGRIDLDRGKVLPLQTWTRPGAIKEAPAVLGSPSCQCLVLLRAAGARQEPRKAKQRYVLSGRLEVLALLKISGG